MADTARLPVLDVNVIATCRNCQATHDCPMRADAEHGAWVPAPHLAWLYLWANAHRGPIDIHPVLPE